MKQYAAEEAKATSPSPQNDNFYLAHYSQKGNQHPDGKNNKGKKGEGNQNKQNLMKNVEGGKKEKKKVKFLCILCQGDHMTYQFTLIDQAQKLLKQQKSVILKDPFPQGQNTTSGSKDVGGTSGAPCTDQSYNNMV